MTAALSGIASDRNIEQRRRNDTTITAPMTNGRRSDKKSAASIPDAVSPPTSATTPVRDNAGGITSVRRCSTRRWVAAACGEVVGIAMMTAALPEASKRGGATAATPASAGCDVASSSTTGRWPGPAVATATTSGPL